MSTNSETKIKKLLEIHRPDTVSLATWLERQGISRDLQKRYRKSGWLQSVGTGAVKRPADTVSWQGGLYALQKQANIPVHVGALTALTLQGLTHYVRLGPQTVNLFSPPKTNLPRWFRDYHWGIKLHHTQTAIMPSKMNLTTHDEKNFTIDISAPERAILECLYLTPKSFDLTECYQVMEGLATLRPGHIQELLERCTSIKVKRLFLYMATKAGHQWMNFLNVQKVELGSGNRSIVKGGTYIPEFKISVSRELASL